MVFDPSKYGATLINPPADATPANGAFDPSKYGATPINSGFPASIPPEVHQTFLQTLKGIGNAVTSSEQKLGSAISTVGSNIPEQQANESAQNTENVSKLLQIYHSTTDPIQKQHLAATLKAMGTDVTAGDINPGFNLSNKQVLGAAAGTLLDVASAGSYGGEASAAEHSGQLVTKSQALSGLLDKAGISSVVAPAEQAVKSTVKPALTQTLKDIGTKTAIKASEGGATGFAYDVSQNAQNDKANILKPGGGTWAGTLLPVAMGAFEAGAAISKDLAPRIINSLVKPSVANFSYGKNPGRTVSEMGITGNNLKEFGNNITDAKQEVGQKIGNIISSPENAGEIIDGNTAVGKIDQAMQEASKGGKNNQAIVTTLQNIKDALLYDHATNADGIITKVSDTPRDLSALNPEQAFQLKQDIASMTRFTGNASDDKTVNATLKSIYGSLKDSINSAVGKNDPEITKLNQQYADLTSAELAVEHRDAIVQRSNLVSLPAAVAGSGAALGTAIVSGGATIPTLLAGAGGIALDKALATTAVKTRVASWLASESPQVIQKLAPDVKQVLLRTFPKFAAQINQTPNN